MEKKNLVAFAVIAVVIILFLLARGGEATPESESLLSRDTRNTPQEETLEETMVKQLSDTRITA